MTPEALEEERQKERERREGANDSYEYMYYLSNVCVEVQRL